MKTETEATADNERIMSRFRTLRSETYAATAETVRLAAEAENADPTTFAAHYSAMWRAYNVAVSSGDEACDLFDSLFEVYRGYFDAAAALRPAEFEEESGMWRKIIDCYDLDAVDAMHEIIRINGKINDAVDAMTSFDPRL